MSLAILFLAKLIEIGIFLVLGFAIETAFEAVGGKKSQPSFNLACTAIFEGFSITLGLGFAHIVIGWVRNAPFHDLVSIGSDHGLFLKALGLIAFQLCVADFFYYWIHRLLLHRYLWAGVHELHHADENMNVTTAKRVHWLENPLQTVFGTIPTVLLFKPALITVVSAIVIGDAIPFFAHLNARINIGMFKRIFINPQTHRIHHSKMPQHRDKNFASHFTFWDVLFGTYYHPQEDEWPETGVSDGKTFDSASEATILPFIVWAKTFQRYLGGRTAAARELE